MGTAADNYLHWMNTYTECIVERPRYLTNKLHLDFGCGTIERSRLARMVVPV